MALSPLLPAAAAAVAPFALKAVRKLSEGLSFADVLRRGGEDRSASSAATEGRQAAPQDLLDIGLANPGRAARLESVRRETQEAMERFRRSLEQRLVEAGIDPSHPIQLQADGRGGVIVGGEHPQRAFIEQVFAEHPELARAFHGLLARRQLLRRLEEPLAVDAYRGLDETETRLLLDGAAPSVGISQRGQGSGEGALG
jgi:hypothetical protein